MSVVPPGAEWRLAPVVVSGAGVPGGHGWLHSPSTRRVGLVTLTDIAPTVLDALRVPVPKAMVGHPLRFAAGEADLGRLARLDRDAAARERVYLPVVMVFTLVQTAVYAAAMATLGRRRQTEGGGGSRGDRSGDRSVDRSGGRGRWEGRLGVAVLAFAAFPLATFLLRAVPGLTASGLAGSFAGLAAIDAVVVAVARRFRRHPLSPLAWVLGLTLAALVLDVATGARLQQASIMGYSPHTAGRFYGLGNTAFAVLAVTTVLLGALHVVHSPRRGEALVTVACLFAVVAVVDGAPSLGDDVGGILTLVPVLTLTFLALAGRRPSWRLGAGAVAATMMVLALATAVDLSRPPESRTHLGRQVTAVRDGGAGVLLATMARKAEVNLRILRGSPWTWIIPVIAVFLLEVVVRQRRGAQLLPRGSPMRIGVVAALATGLLGAAVNDSGVVVTALVLVYVGPFLALAVVDRSRSGEPVLMEPLSPVGRAS